MNETMEDTNTILPRRAMGAAIYLAYEYVERKSRWIQLSRINRATPRTERPPHG